MMVEIISNGSKWAGQSPDTLETLLEVLANHPLDKRWGEHVEGPLTASDFVKPASEFAQAHVGMTHFFGNFFTASHVFSIYTDEPDVIERLTTAIRTNQRRHDYLDQPDPTRTSA